MPFYLVMRKALFTKPVGCTSVADDPSYDYITSPKTGEILEFESREEAELFVIENFKDQYIHDELKDKYPRLRHNYLFK